MIRVGDEIWLTASEVSSVEVNDYRTAVIIRMKCGSVHNVSPKYGELVYESLTRLVREIEKELNK